ncbi:MAG: peptidoglycan DD-metalloendopeptidase family protein [Rubrivivax sp.]|nr:peptidoglycan DD-metalloendopeptidase family protein [Rubrivivax sp.]
MNPQTERALQGIQDFGRKHRLGLVASAVSLMAAFALTAVAVAPLLPDPALLPQRLLTEAVVPEGIQAQLTALAEQELSLIRSDVTRSADTAEALLARLGVRDTSASAFIRSDATARLLLAGRGGKMVQAQTDADGTLKELIARFPAEGAEQARTQFTRLKLSRTDGQWLARLETAELGAQVRLASGSIRSSLFAATDESGIPDAVATQIAEIFATDIDFHRELRKGDTFSIVYESLTTDGEPVAWNEGAGRVLAAEFINAGKAHRAVWFTPADGRGGYFDIDGRSKRRAFLASPMEFSRVTSGFAMRMHPVLQNWRQHNGVDYGAPTGTPVRSVGDGVVEFAGRQNGYGNVVQLRHGSERSTLYGHLSRIDVRKGQRVEQGQRIGAVGMTGLATGPHLHFEFRVGGRQQDPLRIAKASETVPLDASSRPRFGQAVRSVQAHLELAETLAGQRVRAE